MFDIGWSELLVIAVVAVIVIGPKDLPRVMRTVGHYAGKLRRAAADFQRQFEEAMRETEIDEVRKAIESVRENTPSADLKAPIDKPVMLPKQTPQPPPASPQSTGVAATVTEAKAKRSATAAKPAPRKRRAPAKPKMSRAKRPKKTPEPGQ
jgi:sec-independent protein translocase protein TatB